MIPWYRYPQFELVKFRHVEFFPSKPDFTKLKSICIGSKTRTIGDPMMLSTLPEKLKKKYPELQVYVYPRGFNPVVFWNNPFVDGVSFLPPALYGDDCNEGAGQLIQAKERFFGVSVSELPRPAIYLTTEEVTRAKNWLADAQSKSSMSSSRRQLPLLMLHPFGRTRGTVLSEQKWEEILPELQKKFRICQVGILGHPKLTGSDFHFLTPLARKHARDLFAIIAQGSHFVGVDSGPMHIAQAFGLKSVVIIGHLDIDSIHKESECGFLYKNSTHVAPEGVDARFLLNSLR